MWRHPMKKQPKIRKPTTPSAISITRPVVHTTVSSDPPTHSPAQATRRYTRSHHLSPSRNFLQLAGPLGIILPTTLSTVRPFRAASAVPAPDLRSPSHHRVGSISRSWRTLCPETQQCSYPHCYLPAAPVSWVDRYARTAGRNPVISMRALYPFRWVGVVGMMRKRNGSRSSSCRDDASLASPGRCRRRLWFFVLVSSRPARLLQANGHGFSSQQL
ncbi:hypothetical protein HDK77DRAFT_251084 [Phyllosticta capitalensis]|uniref:Uncharacterized protein n=1 Tax=Phyllosticta capitalensis TaxID=121624 RepID=A0ABR1YLQ7_9PEZI